MKKGMCMILTILMAGSIAACGNSKEDGGQEGTKKGSGDEKTKITFALWDEVQKPVFDEIVEKFEAENTDIDVEVQLTPWSQYWTKLDAAMGSDSAADVFWMNTYLPKYAEAGVLEPLDEYIEQDKIDMEDYVSVVKNAYNYKDVQYCMPKGMDTVQVFYNKSIFEKYNVEEPKAGWTWEDMKELAGQLKRGIENEGSDEYPILMELDPQPSFFNFISQSGGYILSDDGKQAGFEKPASVKAYTDIVELIEEGLMPGSEVLSDTKGTDLFLSQSVIGGLGYAVNSRSKNKDAAWKLVKYLSGEESNRMQAEARADVPALIRAQKYYKAEHIDVDVIFDVADTGFAFPTSSSVAEWLPAVNEISAKIFAGELTPEEGCKEMQKVTQNALDNES